MPSTTVISDHAAQQQQRVDDGRAERRVGDEVPEVLEADERVFARLHQVVVDDREVEGHRQRHDHPEEERTDGRRQQQPGDGSHGGLCESCDCASGA
jgi:hypothetical protein